MMDDLVLWLIVFIFSSAIYLFISTVSYNKILFELKLFKQTEAEKDRLMKKRWMLFIIIVVCIFLMFISVGIIFWKMV